MTTPPNPHALLRRFAKEWQDKADRQGDSTPESKRLKEVYQRAATGGLELLGKLKSTERLEP